jgi:hypothetical protein
MNTYSQVEKIRSDFEAKAAQIRQDRDLTQSGKEKALQALTTQKRDAFRSVIVDMRRAAVETAIKADKLSGAQWALNQLEAEKMDYSRLAYEAQAVKSALVLAGDDPFKVTELWQRVKATNDTYKIRAWLDTAPAAIPEKTVHASTWEELKADMVQSQALTYSAEMALWEAKRKAHLNELADISKAAAIVAEDLGTQNIMPRVFEGIALDRASGELKVDFGSITQTSKENPDETYRRLESERAEREKQQAAVFQAFDKEYDPILDGV